MPQSTREQTKILLVDDNPAVLKLLGALFQEQKMAVTLASSAAEAKAALQRVTPGFDLVLSDISMPGESGFDLLSWIKRDDSPYRDLPVLLTTAQLPEAENRVKGLAMGAVDYVVRPIELSELVLRAVHAIDSFKRVRALETSLQDSENLAMVGRLLAASHHEIKNVANLVSLAAEQAARCFATGADDQGRQALRHLSQATTLLTDVSKNVGTLLQPESAPLAPLDLGKLVRDVIDLLQSRVKPHRLEARVTGECWGMAHPGRLQQVLINLILNANDAIEELDSAAGGAITVSVTSDGDERRLVVKDDGIGFAAGERSEFKAFATTKKLRGGQGLGLWLCTTLVRNMGGTLTLRSAGVGAGVEATVTLAGAAKPPADDLDVSAYLADLDEA